MNKNLIVATAILLVGLAYLLSQGETPVTSGIKGVVRLGPTCPVQRNETDPACEDKLYQTELELTRFNSKEVIKTFSSDENGEFDIRVAPGEYSIRDKSATGLGKCGKNGLVPVEADETTEVIVFCDTGIR